MSLNIFITGATGKVAGQVVASLIEKGVIPKVGTRAPEKYTYQGGEEALFFDYTNRESYDPALEGITKAFISAPPLDGEAHLKIIPFIDRAVEKGISHIVLLSAMGVDMAKGTPLNLIEEHVKKSGVTFTILRPNFFMENFFPGWLYQGIKATRAIALPVGESRTSFISVKDIGAIGAEALTAGGHENKEYNLSGGEALTHREVAEKLSLYTPGPITFKDITPEEFTRNLEGAGLPQSMVQYACGLYDMVRAGYTGTITSDVKQVLKREPRSFSEYAAETAGIWK